MKKIGIYAIIAFLFSVISSCLDDNNNYDYIEINELKGRGIELERFHSVLKGKELILSPSFKFTIDSINPDVRYEWYLDKNLLPEETKPTYTFKAVDNGLFQVTFVVVDNKSGVKYAASTFVTVRDVLQRGWVILSEEEGTERSVLNVVLPTSDKYEDAIYKGNPMRDTLKYLEVRRDVNPKLGKKPRGLYNNYGFINNQEDPDFNLKKYDELVVMQDRWEELNGNNLEHEVYTDEEFFGDIPDNFDPVDASMSYTAKAIRCSDGKIYWQNKANIVDFHAGAYVNEPIGNGTKFKKLFPSIKMGQWMTIMLALTEDNSLVGIIDGAYANSWGDYIDKITPPLHSVAGSSEVYEIKDNSGTNRFQKIDKTIVDGFGFAYNSNVGDKESVFTILLKDEDTNEYSLRSFLLKSRYDGIACLEYIEHPIGVINDFRGLAHFSDRRGVVYADGNQLYYCQYLKKYVKWGEAYYSECEGSEGTPIKLGSPLSGRIKDMHGFDLTTAGEKYSHDGQLGVALENGDFFIYGVHEIKNTNDACVDVNLIPLYPNKETEGDSNNFGKIIDVNYKIGRYSDSWNYAF